MVPFPGEAPIFSVNQVGKLLAPLIAPPHQLLVFYNDQGEACTASTEIASNIATAFHCPVLIGLEGVEHDSRLHRNLYYNSAFFLDPDHDKKERYDKEILLPMAESIPFEWAKFLAARYGLFDSFQKGNGRGAVIPISNREQLSSSICYEDTFASLIRKNRLNGATLFTNLTNDGWYPNSQLAAEHLESARPRTVENGSTFIARY